MAQLKVTLLERTTRPVMAADRPWEGMQLNFANVIKIDNTWHMWYSAYDKNYKYDDDNYVCYAYSNDGINWIKPNLGLIEYSGNKDNNILIVGDTVGGPVPLGGVCGQSVFLDKQAPPEERFKIVFIRLVSEGEGEAVYGGTSSDGIHWNLNLTTPLVNHISDTQNVCIKDGNIYRLYGRIWTGPNCTGIRMVSYTESPTFGNFPDRTVIFSDPVIQFYNSAATKIKDNCYVMFPSAYSLTTGLVEPHLAVSQDGINFEQVGGGPFLKFGTGFDSKSIYVCPGCIPGDKPGTYWFYYLGLDKGHDDPITSFNYTGGIGRFLVKV